MDDLRKAVDEVLSETLPARLKATIAAMLEKGVSRAEVVRHVRESEGKRGPLTLAVEAHLGADQNGKFH